MNILVTGSEGFIGKKLVTRLSSDNNVYTLDRNESVSEVATEHFVGDIADMNTLSNIDVTINTIYHFGSASSISSFGSENDSLVFREMKSFVNILEFAHMQRIKKIIYPSTASIYRRESTSGLNIINPSNTYAAIKFAQEQIALFYSKIPNTIGLRIFMAYGPGEKTKGERASPIFQFVQKIMNGEPPTIFGDGSQVRDAIYIDDLIEVVANLTYNDIPSGIYDICTGEPISFNQIIQNIEDITMKKLLPTYLSKPNSYVDGTAGNPNLSKRLLRRPFTSLNAGIKNIYLSLLEEQK